MTTCSGETGVVQTQNSNGKTEPSKPRLAGASITRIPPQKGKTPREMVIRQDICKGCGFCVEFCPSDVLGLSAQINAKGYNYPEAVRPEACSTCGMCTMMCPDFAIFFVAAEEE